MRLPSVVIVGCLLASAVWASVSEDGIEEVLVPMGSWFYSALPSDQLLKEVVDLPSWLYYSVETHSLQGAPLASDLGSYDIVVRLESTSDQLAEVANQRQTVPTLHHNHKLRLNVVRVPFIASPSLHERFPLDTCSHRKTAFLSIFRLWSSARLDALLATELIRTVVHEMNLRPESVRLFTGKDAQFSLSSVDEFIIQAKANGEDSVTAGQNDLYLMWLLGCDHVHKRFLDGLEKLERQLKDFFESGTELFPTTGASIVKWSVGSAKLTGDVDGRLFPIGTAESFPKLAEDWRKDGPAARVELRGNRIRKQVSSRQFDWDFDDGSGTESVPTPPTTTTSRRPSTALATTTTVIEPTTSEIGPATVPSTTTQPVELPVDVWTLPGLVASTRPPPVRPANPDPFVAADSECWQRLSPYERDSMGSRTMVFNNAIFRDFEQSLKFRSGRFNVFTVPDELVCHRTLGDLSSGNLKLYLLKFNFSAGSRQQWPIQPDDWLQLSDASRSSSDEKQRGRRVLYGLPLFGGDTTTHNLMLQVVTNDRMQDFISRDLPLVVDGLGNRFIDSIAYSMVLELDQSYDQFTKYILYPMGLLRTLASYLGASDSDIVVLNISPGSVQFNFTRYSMRIDGDNSELGAECPVQTIWDDMNRLVLTDYTDTERSAVRDKLNDDFISYFARQKYRYTVSKLSVYPIHESCRESMIFPSGNWSTEWVTRQRPATDQERPNSGRPSADPVESSPHNSLLIILIPIVIVIFIVLLIICVTVLIVCSRRRGRGRSLVKKNGLPPAADKTGRASGRPGSSIVLTNSSMANGAHGNGVKSNDVGVDGPSIRLKSSQLASHDDSQTGTASSPLTSASNMEQRRYLAHQAPVIFPDELADQRPVDSDGRTGYSNKRMPAIDPSGPITSDVQEPLLGPTGFGSTRSPAALMATSPQHQGSSSISHSSNETSPINQIHRSAGGVSTLDRRSLSIGHPQRQTQSGAGTLPREPRAYATPSPPPSFSQSRQNNLNSSGYYDGQQPAADSLYRAAAGHRETTGAVPFYQNINVFSTAASTAAASKVPHSATGAENSYGLMTNKTDGRTNGFVSQPHGGAHPTGGSSLNGHLDSADNNSYLMINPSNSLSRQRTTMPVQYQMGSAGLHQQQPYQQQPYQQQSYRPQLAGAYPFPQSNSRLLYR